ncbi:invasion protein CiaB [Candidatus Gracilibacteria bacterium 28_42_T64]|nr:invasion protein CiaB [Candidatus Gracilibacteria bacterium 28_42_T64]
MNKELLEANIQIILDFYKEKQQDIQSLYNGVKAEGKERGILDGFLKFLELEINDETRFVAYSRVASLNEDALKLYLEKLGKLEDEIEEVLYEAYIFVKNYHSDIFKQIIDKVEEEGLLTEFYLELFKGVHKIGESFTDYHLAWHTHIIGTINKNLENEFDADSGKILKYLEKNNLGADKIDGVNADRSYSTLIEDESGYKVVSYAEAFSEEVGDIINSLSEVMNTLEGCEDDVYNKKSAYIKYFSALKNAFGETDCDNLIQQWRKVDETWMEIDTPFQIGHPLEFYEDLYRKSVAPEWDLRIVDTSLFESKVSSDVLKMYETLYDDIGRCKYSDSYEYSLANQKRVQLYISTPVFYYGDKFNGLFSAQVVPNDEEVSKVSGKKIFAFPGFVLEKQRKAPVMKITTEIFEASFMESYKKFLFSEDKNYFGVYDIETIGHEYGHTLWLDLDTEAVMNASGNFKNLEEFKATMGGLVAYFMKESNELKEKVVLLHVYRCIKLLKYREIEDVRPYYCEALIHLDILFGSGIIEFNGKKIVFKNTPENYKKLTELYTSNYKELIYNYLEKRDAGEFLFDYTVKEGRVFLPKNQKIREFVEYYYALYKKIGNEVDKNSN